jgi:hypothetical protein
VDTTREDELLEEELEQEEGLTEEIERRWDPERLLRVVARRAGRGERLDASTRAYFERKLGADLSGVRVYTGAFAEEVAKAHGAEAVTIGTTGMILMRGSPDKSMATSSGRALLAHELTHVAQEQRGVHRDARFGGAPPLATEEHETEARTMAHEEQHGGGAQQRDAQADEEAKKAVEEKIRKRVLEMFAEEERIRLMRNGKPPYRP